MIRKITKGVETFLTILVIFYIISIILSIVSIFIVEIKMIFYTLLVIVAAYGSIIFFRLANIATSNISKNRKIGYFIFSNLALIFIDYKIIETIIKYIK